MKIENFMAQYWYDNVFVWSTFIWKKKDLKLSWKQKIIVQSTPTYKE